MRGLVAYLTALALLLAPTLAWAGPVEVELHYIPVGQRLHCSGEDFQCYTFMEWKGLLLLDAELWSTKNELELIRGSLALRVEEIGVHEGIAVNLSATNKELTVEVSRLRRENDKLLEKNMKLSLPKPGPWIVFVAGLVLMAAGGGMLIGSRTR